jgi:HSP20 family molecular chaperone IbpA
MIDDLFFPFAFPTWTVPNAPAGVTYSNNKLTMELPGVTPEQCKVSVLEQEKALRVEYRKRGTDFKQDFSLPHNIDFEHVEASLQNGLLEVALPYQKQKVREIALTDKPLAIGLDKSA